MKLVIAAILTLLAASFSVCLGSWMSLPLVIGMFAVFVTHFNQPLSRILKFQKVQDKDQQIAQLTSEVARLEKEKNDLNEAFDNYKLQSRILSNEAAGQIGTAMAEAEQAIGGAMESFYGVVSHSQQLLQAATCAVKGDGEDGSLSELSVQTQKINMEIGRIVMAFQFHDLLRQRLEHALTPLRQMREISGATGNEHAEVNDLPMAVGAPPAIDVVSYDADDDGDITLFLTREIREIS